MHWPLICLAAGFLAGSCFLASACRFDGELDGAVLRMIAGLVCCGLGMIAAFVSDFLTWR